MRAVFSVTTAADVSLNHWLSFDFHCGPTKIRSRTLFLFVCGGERMWADGPRIMLWAITESRAFHIFLHALPLKRLQKQNSRLSSSEMEKLVEVSEQEIRINFALNCKCRANVLLRSLCAAAPVAFKVQTSSPHRFLVNPPTGIIPPLSKAIVQIILKPQSQIPSNFPRSHSDRFLIKTAEFDSELDESAHPDSVNSWISTRPTQDIKLKVAFVGPFLLQHAVRSADFESVRNILKRQKSVLQDLSPEEAERLLRIATELTEADDMVNLLLEAGLRIDGGGETQNVGISSGWEPERWMEGNAAVDFDQTVKEARLAKMARFQPFDWRDKKGRTPFPLGVREGNIQCEKTLVGSSVDKNKAMANGNRRMVEIGMGPTLADDQGRLPLYMAHAKRHEDIAGIQGGEELLTAARRGDLPRLRLLLRRDADINFSDQYGLTAIHAAAIKGNKDAVLMLIESGIDLEIRDNEGHAPLHLAVESGKLELVEALIDKGATVNTKTNRGATPLHMAEAMGHTDISQYLMSRS